MKQQEIKRFPLKVEAAPPTPEEIEEQKACLHKKMLDVQNKMSTNEGRLLLEELQYNSIQDIYKKQVEYSGVLKWMQDINMNRFIIPEQQGKQAAESKNGPGKLIVAP